MIPYKRRRLSRFQLDAQRERDEAIQAKAEMEASLANDEKELIEAAKKKKFADEKGTWEIFSSNLSGDF